MIRFTYKLKITERVTAKCSRHPRFNPEKEGRNIKGGCSGCYALFDLWQSRLALEAAAQQFQRKAAPWSRPRQPRKHKPTPPQENAEAREGDQ
jgi:hypothetical protein